MAILGRLLRNLRAGQAGLAWNLPALAGPDVLALRSPDLEHDAPMPTRHAGRRAGGQNLSPALAWASPPAGTAQLLLVAEDVDAPTRSPFIHCVALLAPDVDELPAGALNAGSRAPGVQVLRSGMGPGYLGPEPIKGHGTHRYVFQLYALPTAITASTGGGALEKAKPRTVIGAALGPVLARARLDGLYTR